MILVEQFYGFTWIISFSINDAGSVVLAIFADVGV